MAARFKVHSCSPTTVEVEAKMEDGEKVTAQAKAVVVELTPLDPWRKTLTHVERASSSEQVEALAARFPVGATVEMGDWSLVSAGDTE